MLIDHVSGIGLCLTLEFNRLQRFYEKNTNYAVFEEFTLVVILCSHKVKMELLIIVLVYNYWFMVEVNF